MCAVPGGRGSLKAAVSQVNIRAIDKILQRGTRCHERCWENNQPSSEVETRKTCRSGGSTKQHGRKINGRCLRRLSAALAKTLNGFMHGRRNSTFLGKGESQKILWSSKAGGRLNVNLAFLLFYTDPFDWKNTERFNKHLLFEQEGAHFCSL